MPNYVTNKIEFDCSQEQAEAIFTAIQTDGVFDFNTLIPTPLHVYQGDLGTEEDEDFPVNWHTWNRENWGTKWNSTGSKVDWNNGHASIEFDTAWNVPRPIAVAFGNKFKIDFILKYFDEGSNFWGIEEYKVRPKGFITRKSKRLSDEVDRITLCVELKGDNPDEDRDGDDDDSEQIAQADQNSAD